MSSMTWLCSSVDDVICTAVGQWQAAHTQMSLTSGRSMVCATTSSAYGPDDAALQQRLDMLGALDEHCLAETCHVNVQVV